MVSVAELLNPEPPRAPLPTSRPAPLPPTPRTAALRDEAAPVRRSIETLRMMENTKTPPRCKARGAVNFPPFETLDEASLREVRRFQVHPLGSIRETCERIPYNSGKKDFFSKTGREGFEAFHYDFRIPGDDTNYTIMWDYNVGLVRMTSFFKCRGYSKTTPAKMLNSNPGLKDITYSITGGSIKAQGYWMPYICAKAICATFCHKIAGALIPLFGPRFPFECIPEKAPGHGRMIINPDLVARAKNDAAALFRPPPGLPSPRPSRSASPLSSHRSARAHDPYDYHSDHGHDRRLLLSPYTDTDVDYHPGPEPYGRRVYPAIPAMRIPTSRPSFGPAPVPTPLHSPGWTAVNHAQLPAAGYHHRAVSHLNEELHDLNVSATASPWLSAIPRSPTPASGGGPIKWHPHYPRSHHHDDHYQHTSSPVSTSLPERGITLPPLRLKRRFDQVDDSPHNNNNNNTNKGPTKNNDEDDKAYDAEAEEGTTHPSTSSPSSPSSPSTPSSPEHQNQNQPRIIRAPPPTPTSTSTSTSTAARRSSSSSSKATTPPRTSITIPIIPTTTAGAASAHEPIARRASERDAAIMLLHMRGRQGSVNASPSSGPPSPSTSSVDSSSSSDADNHESHLGGRNEKGATGMQGRTEKTKKKKKEEEEDGKSLSGRGDEDSDREGGDVGHSAGGAGSRSKRRLARGGEKGRDADEEGGVCAVRPSSASDAGEAAVSRGGEGPNTRAKRRRTVER